MPRDSLPEGEFEKRMEGFDEEVYRILEDRMRTNFKRERYEFLTPSEVDILGAMLDRLIPQDGGTERIDLVGFMDWAIPLPLGYGDRRERMPEDETVFREGLRGVDETAADMFGGLGFVALSDGDKDQVLRAVQEGRARGRVWERIPSELFFNKLMQKAVAGYCAHPRTWIRIGFYGPSYPEGYIWVSHSEVKARHEKKPGHLTF